MSNYGHKTLDSSSFEPLISCCCELNLLKELILVVDLRLKLLERTMEQQGLSEEAVSTKLQNLSQNCTSNIYFI